MSRRQRRVRQERRGSASARQEVKSPPGRASDFVSYTPLTPGSPVIYYERESPTRGAEERLHRRVDHYVKVILRRGASTIDTFAGIETSDINGYRPKLEDAIARAYRTGRMLLFSTLDRGGRHCEDGQVIVDAELSVAEYEQFLRLLKPLRGNWTILEQVSTFTEGRSQQTKRGIAQARKARRAPGYKKRERLLLIGKVFFLTFVGMKPREISQRTGVPELRVRNWIERAIVNGLTEEELEGIMISVSNPQGTIEWKLRFIRCLRDS